MDAKGFWKATLILFVLWLLCRAYAISIEVLDTFDLMAVATDAVVFVIMVVILVLFIKKNKLGFRIGKFHHLL